MVPSATFRTSSPPQSPRTAPLNMAAVARTAETHLKKVYCADAAPLVGIATFQYNFGAKHQEASRLLLEGKKEEARELFGEILRNLKFVKLGIDIERAFLDESQSYSYAIQVKEELDIVYANRNEWDSYDRDKKAQAYYTLRQFLRQIQILIPSTEVSIHEELTQKLEECAKHIPLLFEFSELIKNADQLFKQTRHPEARELYKNALKLIEGKPGNDYLVAQTDCLLQAALSSPDGSDERHTMSLQAKDTIFQLYAIKETLYSEGKSTKENVFNLLLGLLTKLIQFFPDTENEIHQEINEKRQECQIQLKQFPATSSATGPSASNTLPRKVTSDFFSGSWSLDKIFTALVWAIIAVVKIIAIYRRFTTAKTEFSESQRPLGASPVEAKDFSILG